MSVSSVIFVLLINIATLGSYQLWATWRPIRYATFYKTLVDFEFDLFNVSTAASNQRRWVDFRLINQPNEIKISVCYVLYPNVCVCTCVSAVTCLWHTSWPVFWIINPHTVILGASILVSLIKPKMRVSVHVWCYVLSVSVLLSDSSDTDRGMQRYSSSSFYNLRSFSSNSITGCF
jgi:hypothetical protein